MSTTTERELGYALGMVERRVNLAATIGKSSTQNEAISVHKSVCGAVKEVRKHHKNILGSIDTRALGTLCNARLYSLRSRSGVTCHARASRAGV